MLERPYERRLPLNLKDSLLEGEIISEGKAICSLCNKIVSCKEIKRGGFVYLIKECPDQKIVTETLIRKYDYSDGRYNNSENYLKKYAYYDMDLGDVFSSSIEKIANRERVNTYVIRITDRCNENCRICNEGRRRKEKDVTLSQLLQLQMLKNSHIALSGGEPTLVKDLPRMITALKKLGNQCYICTCGMKLADLDYVNMLKDSGLDRVLLSFDGFREDIYERLRGGKSDYYYKLKALGNLEKRSIPTAIQFTVVKGINEDEIGKVLDYAREHPFINGVWIKPLFLPGTPKESGFNISHLVSVGSLKDYVCRYFGISHEYFELFYQCKLKLFGLFEKFLPKVRFSHPQQGQLFFRRNGSQLKPLLSREELRNLCNGNFFDFKLFFRWLPFMFKSRFSPLAIEKNLLEDKVLGIIVATSKGPRDKDLSKPIHYLYLEMEDSGLIGLSSEALRITPEG